MRRFGVILLALLVTACGGESAQEAYDSILEKEDSLAVASTKLKPGELMSAESSIDLIRQLEEFVKNFPDDPHAPECLDKIHMAYTGLQDYKNASLFADRVLKEYPDYVNRVMVLESQAGNYDMFIQPRDTSKVRYYYELLLKEDISAEKKKDVKKRLDHIDLTFEQYIMAQ